MVPDIPGLRYVKQTSVTFGVGTMDRIGALQRYSCKVTRATTSSSQTVDRDAAIVTRPNLDQMLRVA